MTDSQLTLNGAIGPRFLSLIKLSDQEVLQ